MFRCEACDAQQGERIRPAMVVTQVRLRDEAKGWGYEIAEEVKMCASCAIKHTHLKLTAITGRGSMLSHHIRCSLLEKGYIRPDPDEISDIETAQLLARAHGISLANVEMMMEAVS